MITPSLTTRILGWTGIIPFVLAAWFSFQEASLFGFYPPYVFIAFSGIVLAFLSGAMWGRVYEQKHRTYRKRLLLFSNVFALLAFCGILFSTVYLPLAVALLGVGFWLIWRVEILCFDSEWTSDWYLKLRKHLTYVVVCLHGVVLLTLVF